MYVIQASPLSRIFLPAYQRKLIDKPALIFDPSLPPFEVVVPRVTGAVRLTHMKPVHQHNLLPRKGYVQDESGKVRELKRARVADRDEIRDLVPWLTGGDDGMGCEETDIYGIVQFDIGTDIVQEMVELMQSQLMAGGGAESNQGDFLKMKKRYDSQVAAQLARARQIADEKVKRALRITHSNLIQSWDALETEGKGRYQASAAEGLGAFILNEEIAAGETSRQQMHDLLKHGSQQRPVVNG